MARAKQPVSINGIEFDALIDESRTLEATVPEYSVESGFSVSDAIILSPEKLDMTLFVTNTPVTWYNRHGGSQNRVDSVVKQLEELYYAGSRSPSSPRTPHTRTWPSRALPSARAPRSDMPVRSRFPSRRSGSPRPKRPRSRTATERAAPPGRPPAPQAHPPGVPAGAAPEAARAAAPAPAREAAAPMATANPASCIARRTLWPDVIFRAPRSAECAWGTGRSEMPGHPQLPGGEGAKGKRPSQPCET